MKVRAFVERLKKMIGISRKTETKKPEYYPYGSSGHDTEIGDAIQEQKEREFQKESEPGYRFRKEQWERWIESHGDL